MTDTIIETSTGKLRGTSSNGIHVFKGIPYAGPAGGSGRFMPPAKLEPWTGVRDALDYGASSIQPQLLEGIDINSEVANLLSGVIGLEPESENCLFLNVWTPNPGDGGRRPVMFWCHGGGFAIGSGSATWYNGENLSRHGDVVVVTVNHRLGPFGYLYLGELGGERYAASGNAGMLDLVAALEWVRDNITAFGGDYENVTIFGESGGGGKVSVLLAMPATQGLFHRAIIESGPAVQVRTREKATRQAEALLAALRLDAHQLDELQSVPAERIMAAQASASRNMPEMSGPVVDGHTLPHQPFDPVAPSVSVNVPVIIGTNRDEATLFPGADSQSQPLDEEGLHKRLQMVLGSELEPVLAAYRSTRPDASPDDLLVAVLTDSMMRIESITLAERKQAQGAAPVYMYLFAWETPVLGGRLKATHGLEIPFVFDNLTLASMLTGDSPECLTLSKQMSEAWLAFARTGNPNHPGLPVWPPYTPAQRATMIFDTTCYVELDPGRQERLAWKQVSPKRALFS